MGEHSLSDVTQWLDPGRRAWLYDVSLGAGSCSVALGLAADGKVQAVLMLVGALLGFGGNFVARRNVSPGPRDGNPNPGLDG